MNIANRLKRLEQLSPRATPGRPVEELSDAELEAIIDVGAPRGSKPAWKMTDAELEAAGGPER